MKKIAIVGAAVIDATGAPPIEDGVVLVEENKIATTGKRGKVPIPPRASVIDATGRFLLPGLVDCHVHVYYPGFVSTPPRGLEQAYAGVVAMRNLRCALRSGVTTVRDLGSGYIGLALKTAIERGLVSGPRVLAAGAGICITGGHGSGQVEWCSAQEADSPEAVRRAVRRDRKAGADLIKLLSSNRHGDFVEFTLDELKAGVDEAHRLGMQVAVHASTYSATRLAALAGADTIEHGIAIDGETAAVMAEKGISLVPTLWVLHDIFNEAKALKDKYEKSGEYRHHPDRERIEGTLKVYTGIVQDIPKTMEIIRKYEVRVATGTDNIRASRPFAMLHKEIEFLTQYGFSNMEAIQAATRVGAEALGLADKLGTIEPGKIADLIMVDRDPLQDITALGEVSWVMKDGRVVPLSPEWRRRPIREPCEVA